jgi:site-specific recombinase XerD
VVCTVAAGSSVTPVCHIYRMDTAELIKAHHTDQVRRGLMLSSIEQRGAKLVVFARFLDPTGLLDATRGDIEQFLDARQIGSRTRYAWLSHLSSFYDWAIRDDLLMTNPTLRIIRPKMRRALPRPAATSDLRRALGVAAPDELCWLLLAAYMGLRCQEIAGLRREDVLEGESVLRVTKAKGGKERLVPLHPDVLEAFRCLPMPRVGWMFQRPRGGPYNPVQMSQNFNGFLRRAGVDATAHQLRHWFGTNLYAQSHDIRMTQEMLGHANPATTAIYTAFDQRAAMRSVQAMSFNDPGDAA